MKHATAIEALQSLQGPDGWRPGPYVTLDDDRRLWERVDGARGIVGHVTVRAMGGNRTGWYRVRGTAIGGAGLRWWRRWTGRGWRVRSGPCAGGWR